MALFGKKKKKQKKAEAEAAETQTRDVTIDDGEDLSDRDAQIKRLKRSEKLESVMSETVTDQVMNTVRTCSPLRVTHQGSTYYVGLMLDTLKVGGLSRKKKNDADRGQVLECINNGQISVIATKALLDNEYFILVPSKESVECAVEFGFLRKAPYTCIFISDDGSVMTPYWEDNVGQSEIPIALDDVEQMYSDDGIYENIVDYFMEQGAMWACDECEQAMNGDPGDFGLDDDFDEDEDDEIVLDDEPMPGNKPHVEQEAQPRPAPQPAQAPQVTQPMPAQPQPQVLQSQPAVSQRPDVVAPTAQQANTQAVGRQTAANDYGRQAPQPSPHQQQQQGRVVSTEAWYEQAHNSFYSEDLNLKVTADRFDTQFAKIASSCIGFSSSPIDRKGYIPEYLDEMRANANADLRRLHRDNINRLRVRYVQELAKAIVDIQNKMDLSAGSEWAERKAEIDKNAEAQTSQAGALIDSAKRRLDADYERAAKAYADAQSANALSEYHERHGAEHARQLSRVQADVQSDIDAERAAELNKLYEEREAEAQSVFELAQARIMEDIVKEYDEVCVPAENALFKQHDRRMRDWLDENRANDLAYAETVQEKIRIDNSVKRAQEAAAAQIHAMREQNAADVQRLKSQIDEMARQRADAINELRERHEIELERLREENRMLAEHEQKLADKVVSARKDAEQDALKQVEYLQLQIKQQDEQRLVDARHHRMMLYAVVAFAIILAVAAAAIGVIYGVNNYAMIFNTLS